MSSTRRVYLDNNATTMVAPEAVDAMLPYFREHYGNPSSPHGFARKPAMAVSQAREQVAALLGAPADRVVFTSGGTESNAQALLGSLPALASRNEIILSAVEHASVWAWRQRLTEMGYTVHVIPVDCHGALDVDVFSQQLSKRTALVSVMMANNENGVIYPVKKITERAHAVGAVVHTDAVQAVGKIPVNLTALGVDYASICGHKFHAVKGVGALYVRDVSQFRPLFPGGEQEFGRRPGTESVASIVSFGVASELAQRWLVERGQDDLSVRRDTFESWAAENMPDIEILGKSQSRLPNTTQMVIRGVETEPLLALLDMAGVACSSGSACASGAHEASHVLLAMGYTDEKDAVVRVSSSRYTSNEDYFALQNVLKSSVDQLRVVVAPG